MQSGSPTRTRTRSGNTHTTCTRPALRTQVYRLLGGRDARLPCGLVSRIRIRARVGKLSESRRLNCDVPRKLNRHRIHSTQRRDQQTTPLKTRATHASSLSSPRFAPHASCSGTRDELLYMLTLARIAWVRYVRMLLLHCLRRLRWRARGIPLSRSLARECERHLLLFYSFSFQRAVPSRR